MRGRERLWLQARSETGARTEACSETSVTAAVLVCFLFLALGAAGRAQGAALTATPSVLTVAPGAVSAAVQLSCSGCPAGPVGFEYPASIRSHVTTQPAAVNLTSPPAAVALPTTATFHFSLDPTTPAGTYLVTLNGPPPSSPITHITLIVPAPLPSLTANPNVVTVGPGGAGPSIQLTCTNCSTGAVGFAYPGSLRFHVGTTPAPVDLAGTPGAMTTAIFTFTLDPTTPVGTYVVTLTGPPPGSPVTHVTIVVPAASYSLTATPAAITLVPGGDSPAVTLTCNCGGREGNAVFHLPATLASHVRTEPGSVYLAKTGPGAGTVVATFRLRGDPGTPPGSYAIRVDGTQPGVATTLMLTIGQEGVQLTPAALTIPAGQRRSDELQVSGVSGVTLHFEPQLPSPLVGKVQVIPQPVVVSIPAGASTGEAGLTLAVAESARPGRYVLPFASTDGTNLPRGQLSLTILPEPPAVDHVLPDTAPAGVTNYQVQLLGRHFEPGAQLVLSSAPEAPLPPATMGRLRVLSSTRAQAELSLPANLPPGALNLEIENPDGGISSPGGVLLVRGSNSLVGPVGVKQAAVVYPSAGTLLAQEEAMYPRALLVTSGTGIVVGSWLLDGQVFDRFVVHARGGLPVKVTSHIPIPRTTLGSHSLQIAVEQPQQIVSPGLRILEVVQRSSGMRLLAPGDGTVLAPASRPLFRWSIVPGAQRYRITVTRQAPLLPLVHESDVPQWSPRASELAVIGPGEHQWKVSAIFPGNVVGRATPERRLVIVPNKVALHLAPVKRDPQSGRPVLRWQGGAPGLVYQVTFRSVDGRRILLSALTSRQVYLPPSGFLRWSQVGTVRITALAPGGTAVGHSQPLRVSDSQSSATGSRYELTAAPAPVTLTGQEPADRATIDNPQPHFAASWKPAVDPANVTLAVDNTDVTTVATVTGTSISYDSLLTLDPGRHEVQLKVGVSEFNWSFDVAGSSKSPGPASGSGTSSQSGASGSKAARHFGDWSLTTNGTVQTQGASGQSNSAVANASLSAQTSSDNGREFTRVTGDLSGEKPLHPSGSLAGTNHSWIVDSGHHQSGYTEEAVVGYSPPAFLANAQLLTTGLARGATTLSLGGPYASADAFSTFNNQPAGVSAGNAVPAQKVKAASLNFATTDKRGSFRFVGLEVREQASPFFPADRKDRLYGFLSSFTVSPRLAISFEGARSDVALDIPGAPAGVQGNAFHLNLSGNLGTLGYVANVRYTQSNFLNLANSGTTPGSVPDRTGADLTLTKTLGRGSLVVALGEQENQQSSASRGKQRTLNMSYASQLTPAVSLSLAGSYTQSKANADPKHGLPAADANDWMTQASLSETKGTLSFAQTLSVNETNDSLDPTLFNRTSSATFSANASPSAKLALFGSLTGTHTEQNPLLGSVDTVVVSFNPTFNLIQQLTLTPNLNVSRTRQQVVPGWSTAESYGLAVDWRPGWWGSLLDVQLGGTWTRSRQTGVVPSGFQRSYTLSISFNRLWSHGQPEQAGSTPLPAPASAALGMPGSRIAALFR